MEPTFDNGQYLIIDEISYHLANPERGDVIVFRYPRDPSQYFIKRVIGLPGETVKIQNGKVSVVTIAGETIQLDESYIVFHGNGSDTQVVLGVNQYFVMGDNRPESSDSRVWGVLPRQNIIGRVFLRLLPIESASLLPGSTSQQ